MAAYTIYTWGGGEVLETLFNAIAALIGGKDAALHSTLLRLGLMTGALLMVIKGLSGNLLQSLGTWFIPTYALIMVFFAPTTTIQIKDIATGHFYTVANVPWGLGSIAGTISSVSFRITEKIEMAFSLPDDLKYHQTGAMMASNLISEARTFHITNTEVAETMKDFVNQCVVYSMLLGTKYTIDDVKNSKDLWKLVKENASPARSFTYRDIGIQGKTQILTCQEGVKKLDELLNKQIEKSFDFFGTKLFPTNGTNPSALLKSYIPAAYGYMGQMAHSAEDLMRQQMMIYSVIDGIESKSTSLGNAQNFALRRAYLQQRSTQETSAGLAHKTMLALKNVTEALIYALFIFVVPLAMVPAGWRFIGNWASMVVWVQMWAPLYAILNFIMNAAARSKGIGVIASAGGITIANSVGFSELHADMAAQAGYMSLSVGALAYALVKGGASGMVSLASNVTGQIGGAAGRATEDMLSGNYSFGNVSTGNMQASNETFGQQMLSPSYSSGAFTDNTGVVSSVTNADGSRTVNVANSNLRSSLQWGENLSSTLSEQAQQSLAASQSSMQAYGQTQGDAYRNALEFGSHMAQQKSYGDSISQAEQASANASFNKLDSYVQQFADENKINKEQASQLLAKASVGMSAGFSFMGNGATASAEIGAHLQHTNSNTKTWSKAQQFAKNASFQEALQKTVQYSQDSRFSYSDETAQRLGSSAASSFEKANQYRNETQSHLQKAESYSQSANWAKQNSASINTSLNQEFVEWLPQQALPNSNGSMGRQASETIFASQPEMVIPYQQRFLEERFGDMKGDMLGHPAGSPSKVQQTYDAFSQTIPRQDTADSRDEVLKQATQSGLDTQEFNSVLEAREKHMNTKAAQYMQETQAGIYSHQQQDIDKAGAAMESSKHSNHESLNPPVQGLSTTDLSDINHLVRKETQNQMEEFTDSYIKNTQSQIDLKKLGIKNGGQ